MFNFIFTNIPSAFSCLNKNRTLNSFNYSIKMNFNQTLQNKSSYEQVSVQI